LCSNHSHSVKRSNMKPTTHTPILSPTLAQAESLIGGQVSLVFEQGDIQVLADENAMLKGLAPNNEASELCGVQVIGNAIILKGDTRWV
jgi:hypothetical protein